MQINWKVRIKNPTFWVTLIPAVLLLIQCLLVPFGISWDYSVISEQLVNIVNAIFAVLAILGITVDMTTAGLSDSERAMTYNQPYKRD